MLYGTFKGNASTRYGVENEIIAKEELENVIGNKIQSAGMIVDIDQPFLAVSPDGLIDREFLVEIKCPSSAKELTPLEAINNKIIKCCEIKNGNLFLKRNDNYYYQIQGQLHVTRRMYCYFCIWTPKGIWLFKK